LTRKVDNELESLECLTPENSKFMYLSPVVQYTGILLCKSAVIPDFNHNDGLSWKEQQFLIMVH
jgi:hypothetical protein